MSATGRGRPVIRLLESECPSLDLGKLLAECRRGTQAGAIVWFDSMCRGGGRLNFRMEGPGHLGPVLRLAYNVGDRAVVEGLPPAGDHAELRRPAMVVLLPGGPALRPSLLPPGRQAVPASRRRPGLRTCHRLVYECSRESHRWDVLFSRAGWTIQEGLRLIREAMVGRRATTEAKGQCSAMNPGLLAVRQRL